MNIIGPIILLASPCQPSQYWRDCCSFVRFVGKLLQEALNISLISSQLNWVSCDWVQPRQTGSLDMNGRQCQPSGIHACCLTAIISGRRRDSIHQLLSVATTNLAAFFWIPNKINLVRDETTWTGLIFPSIKNETALQICLPCTIKNIIFTPIANLN